MLWEIEVRPSSNETDREAARVISAVSRGVNSCFSRRKPKLSK